jgi:hypothetical protein
MRIVGVTEASARAAADAGQILDRAGAAEVSVTAAGAAGIDDALPRGEASAKIAS